MLKAAICDDEEFHRQLLSAEINSCSTDYSIDEYSSGAELLKYAKKYDIFFLDIEMPDLSGMETAQLLRKNNIDSPIIFLTSHSEYIYDAFKVKAFRFLNKPIGRAALAEALKEAETEILNEEKLVITQKGRIYTIPLKNIIYFEAFGDGTYIYDIHGNTYECTTPLKTWNDSISDKGFFKIHKSYIVSLRYVSSLENSILRLANIKTSFKISRRNLAGFKEAYFSFVKSNAHVI